MAQRVSELMWRVMRVNSRMRPQGFALSLTYYGSTNFLILEKRRLTTAGQIVYDLRAWLEDGKPPNNIELLEAQITKEEQRYNIKEE